jgi:phosphatidylinositol glycan class O
VLIIDALRFDFIAPQPAAYPESPFHHGVITLPVELTKQYPDRSFIFNSYADPPTTTLQRIKALTTGSLPSFVEILSSLGGLQVEEDTIIGQMEKAGK